MIQLLAEYLNGEGDGDLEQLSSSQISRLIIAGNSFSPLDDGHLARKMGTDSVNTFTPHPTQTLSSHLQDIAQVMPIHLLPGDSDPSGTIIPQQPLPRGMFPGASSYASFTCETNPTYIRLDPLERSLLVNSGQPLNDMFKYLPSPPHTRLDILESTLKWRHIAPTAPDTLWCHPYFSADPFILNATPDFYVVGGQKQFGTRLVTEGERRSRVIMVPDFSSTGTLVVANMRTLDVRTISFNSVGMSGTCM
jgi:DNA polymerase delta subunit 2